MRFIYTRARRVVARVAPFCLPCLAIPALSLSLSACTGILDGDGSDNAGQGSTSGNSAGNSFKNGGSANGAAGNGNGGGVGPGQNPDLGSPIQAAPTWRLTNR